MQEIKWYRIVILLMVGLIVLALVLPLLFSTGMEASKASVVSHLRSLHSVQELYKSRTGVYGDCCDLGDERGREYIYRAPANADPDHPEHEDCGGYNIDISVNADNSDWCAIAYPARWGTVAEMNFKATSDGYIYYNATEGDTTNFPYVLGRQLPDGEFRTGTGEQDTRLEKWPEPCDSIDEAHNDMVDVLRRYENSGNPIEIRQWLTDYHGEAPGQQVFITFVAWSLSHRKDFVTIAEGFDDASQKHFIRLVAFTVYDTNMVNEFRSTFGGYSSPIVKSILDKLPSR